MGWAIILSRYRPKLEIKGYSQTIKIKNNKIIKKRIKKKRITTHKQKNRSPKRKENFRDWNAIESLGGRERQREAESGRAKAHKENKMRSRSAKTVRFVPQYAEVICLFYYA